MARNYLLILAVVSLAVLAAAADSYAFKTVVTTTSIFGGRNDGCREEIERQDLSGCERYMAEGSRGDLDQCCEELEQVEDECQMEALREAMRSQAGKAEGREMMERMSEARQTCRVGGGGGGRKIRMMH